LAYGNVFLWLLLGMEFVQNKTNRSPICAPEIVTHDVKHVEFFLKWQNFVVMLTNITNQIENMYCYFTRRSSCYVMWWVRLSMCLSVRKDISETARAIFTNFLCMLPMSVARSSFGTLMIGRIAYWQEGDDGDAQHGRSVIYNCLVATVLTKCNFPTIASSKKCSQMIATTNDNRK